MLGFSSHLLSEVHILSRGPMNNTLIIVERVVTAAIHLFGTDGRRGGYFALTSMSGAPTLISRHGQMRDDKGVKYLCLAQEKCLRLAEHPDHFTSFESRDPNATVNGNDWGKWGGAIRGTRYLFGFSGLSELQDEAIAAVIAIKSHEASPEEMLARLPPERNRDLPRLLGACTWTE